MRYYMCEHCLELVNMETESAYGALEVMEMIGDRFGSDYEQNWLVLREVLGFNPSPGVEIDEERCDSECDICKDEVALSAPLYIVERY